MKTREQLERLLEAKRQLYSELLRCQHGDWTPVETELGFQLSRDEQIQALIEKCVDAQVLPEHI